MEEMVTIVIVNYNGQEYIDKCIQSILDQSFFELEIIFIDNNSNDKSLNVINNYLDDRIKIISNKNNLGYSGGANQGIKLSNGEFIVIMNPDIVLEADFLEKCYNYISNDENIAVVSGKLLKYDFKNNKKLNIIDSVGIGITHARKFYDIGQNIEDSGLYENDKRVFAVCGAVPFYRRSALEKVKVFDEYYDEDFFAYKEDIDLCWRINLYGYKCMYLHSAVAYHGRGMNGADGVAKFIDNRKTQSEFLRGISFRNHYLMLIKNETDFSWKKDKLKIIIRFFVFVIYSILFERFNLKYLKEIKGLKTKMLEKRLAIKKHIKISKEEFYKLFDE